MMEITQQINAPPDAVFAAWSQADQVQRWWGPHGFTTPVCTIDFRPGGAWHCCMRSPQGRDYWCKGVYREIVPGERIVTTDSFSDPEGGLVQPVQYGMSADWPAETLITATFAARDGGTRLTVRHDVSDALAAESGAVQGWTESLQRLAVLLDPCLMNAEPHEEHRWLNRLLGEWTSEAEFAMEPGQAPSTFVGTESVRTLGGLWVLAEGRGEMPSGGGMATVMTLGFDPRRERYVGTFVGSMMTHLWLYEGTRDGQVLTLDTEGPNPMTGGQTLAKFKDVITIESDDHRVLTSAVLTDDGTWRRFMTAHYRRRA